MFARITLFFIALVLSVLPGFSKVVELPMGSNPSWVARQYTGSQTSDSAFRNASAFRYVDPKTGKDIKVFDRFGRPTGLDRTLRPGTLIVIPDALVATKNFTVLHESLGQVCETSGLGSECVSELKVRNRVRSSSAPLFGIIQVPVLFPEKPNTLSLLASSTYGRMEFVSGYEPMGEWAARAYRVLAVAVAGLYAQARKWVWPVAAVALLIAAIFMVVRRVLAKKSRQFLEKAAGQFCQAFHRRNESPYFPERYHLTSQVVGGSIPTAQLCLNIDPAHAPDFVSEQEVRQEVEEIARQLKWNGAVHKTVRAHGGKFEISLTRRW